MSETLIDDWPEILREAIKITHAPPVVGTIFRNSVISAASIKGLQFPPSGEPGLRFIQLLQRYPEVVSVLRRPGQDFLVVPAGRSDLLAKGIQGQLYGIRQDLFLAFSTVSANTPYYKKGSDEVIWRKPEGGQISLDCVPIEPTTEAAEIQLRRDFAQTLAGQPTISSRLTEALGNLQPLQAFSLVVRQERLQREWHSFRTERLIEKIQRWAKDKKVEWKEAWLTEEPTNHTRKDQSFPSHEKPDRADSDPLQLLISALDKADIQRIAIPLDLVLKAISASRKL